MGREGERGGQWGREEERRVEEREREGERAQAQSYPGLGIEPATLLCFCVQGGALTTEKHWPGPYLLFNLLY